MLVTRKSKLHVRAQNIIFVALLLTAVGLVAWLSTRYVWQADWTAGNRNTLTEASRLLLDTLEHPVSITTFAREDEGLRNAIRDLVGRYQRAKPDVTLEFVNPDLEPARVREQGIQADGELVIEYQGRREQLRQLNEDTLTNALQRLARGGERWVVFLTGHGERDPRGQANHDLGAFGRELEAKGLRPRTLNLAKQGAIPRNTSVLVVAGPQTALLPGEVELIRDYIAGGGNLLWLGDPDANESLVPLAQMLGVRFLPGMALDATAQLFGVNDPRIVIVADYPASAITRDFDVVTVFPQATALETDTNNTWEANDFLRTLDRAWQETGSLQGAAQYDPDSADRAGPLAIGVALTRPPPANGNGAAKTSDAPENDESAAPGSAEQRVVVTGDGDFLANAYLGNSGNLDLGLAIVNWLAHDDTYISVPARSAPDTNLTLSQTQLAIIAVLFLVVIPVTLLASGVAIWARRRKR